MSKSISTKNCCESSTKPRNLKALQGMTLSGARLQPGFRKPAATQHFASCLIRSLMRLVIDSLLQRIEVVPFGEDAAYVTGQLRASLARAGTPIGPYDVMIAGTALIHGLILVTANTREFSRVFGLQLENWRELSTEVRENTAVYRVNVKSPPRVPDGRW
jgi:hypothetical protein